MAIVAQLSRTQKVLASVAGTIASMAVIIAFLSPIIPFALAEDLKDVERRVEALEDLPAKIDSIQLSIQEMQEADKRKQRHNEKQNLVNKIKEMDGRITEIDLELQFTNDEHRKAFLIQKKIYWNGEKVKLQTDLNDLNTG